MQLFQGATPCRFRPLYALIGGRVIQAFGAGAMVPVSMALVADLFPPEKRALPLGIIGAVDTAGWVLGHLYGGIMVQFMSWPYLFWINLPGRLRDLLHHVVGIGRPAADGREGRHRLDRRDASWRGADPAQYRPRLAGNRRSKDRPLFRRRIGCTGLPAAAVDVRHLSGFAAARARSDPRSYASSRTAICRRRAASICSSASASWWRWSVFRSSSTSRARQTR